jgi:hypothetical protein
MSTHSCLDFPLDARSRCKHCGMYYDRQVHALGLGYYVDPTADLSKVALCSACGYAISGARDDLRRAGVSEAEYPAHVKPPPIRVPPPSPAVSLGTEIAKAPVLVPGGVAVEGSRPPPIPAPKPGAKIGETPAFVPGGAPGGSRPAVGGGAGMRTDSSRPPPIPAPKPGAKIGETPAFVPGGGAGMGADSSRPPPIPRANPGAEIGKTPAFVPGAFVPQSSRYPGAGGATGAGAGVALPALVPPSFGALRAHSAGVMLFSGDGGAQGLRAEVAAYLQSDRCAGAHLRVQTAGVSVQLSDAPFAKGGFHLAHTAVLNGRQVCAKEAVLPDDDKAQHHLLELCGHVLARELAQAFCQRLGVAPSGVFEYTQPCVLYVPTAPRGKWFIVDAYLDSGRFDKFNVNTGEIINAAHEMPQAFTHFCLHASGGRTTVLDVQGVGQPGQGYTLTDPVVTTRDRRDFPGAANWGNDALVKFGQQRQCGVTCARLRLPALGR